MKAGCTIIDGRKFVVLAGKEGCCPFNSPGPNKGNCRYPGYTPGGVAWKGECLGPEYIENSLCPLKPCKWHLII